MAAQRSLSSRLLIVARYGLILAVIGFAGFQLARQWPDVKIALASISALSLVVSVGMLLAGLVCGTLAWVTLLNGLGDKVPVIRGAQIALVGGLGKYVPGSVWAYLLQMELGRAHGVLRGRVLVASLYAAGIGVVSSLVLGALAMPTVLQGHRELLWLFLLLPFGLACLHPRVMTWLASTILRLFKRPPLQSQVSLSTVLKAFGLTLLSYVLYGLHLWFLVNALVDPTLMTLILLVGAISLGFTIGLLAFMLPSGIGAREAILIGAMTLLLTQAQATAVSLVSRAMFVGSDLLVAGAAALAALAVRRKLSPADETELSANYPVDAR